MRDFERRNPNLTIIDQRKEKEKSMEAKKSNAFLLKKRMFNFKKSAKQTKGKDKNEKNETRMSFDILSEYMNDLMMSAPIKKSDEYQVSQRRRKIIRSYPLNECSFMRMSNETEEKNKMPEHIIEHCTGTKKISFSDIIPNAGSFMFNEFELS